MISATTRELIFVVEEAQEGGFQARALDEAIFTEGETLEELKSNIKDAMDCHYDEKEEKPRIVRLHIVRDEIFSYV